MTIEEAKALKWGNIVCEVYMGASTEEYVRDASMLTVKESPFRFYVDHRGAGYSPVFYDLIETSTGKKNQRNSMAPSEFANPTFNEDQRTYCLLEDLDKTSIEVAAAYMSEKVSESKMRLVAALANFGRAFDMNIDELLKGFAAKT